MGEAEPWRQLGPSDPELKYFGMLVNIDTLIDLLEEFKPPNLRRPYSYLRLPYVLI